MYLSSFFLAFSEENFPLVEVFGIHKKYAAKIFSRKIRSIYTLVDSVRECSFPYFLVPGNHNSLFPLSF